MKKTLFITCLMLSSLLIFAQQESKILSRDEMAALKQAMQDDTLLANYMNGYDNAVRFYEDYKLRVRRSDSIWTQEQNNLEALENIGLTESLEILPLIDWFTKNDDLIGEAGVSYLIRTDDATILFDLGRNTPNLDPSPLLWNMEKLGIGLDDIDMIVISHNHGDHTGGGQWSAENTFSLTSHQIELGDMTVYTPEEMTYPGLDPVYSPQPVKIAEGVTTIGVINCPMFFSEIGEQALAINVKDKGIVVISGCGHQTIEKIVLRTERLFNEPLYGLLGGFHLPVAEVRNIGRGYKYSVTGNLPWDHLTVEDIENKIAFLKKHGLKLTGISAHDSCDVTTSTFRKAFQGLYVDIIVGTKITL